MGVVDIPDDVSLFFSPACLPIPILHTSAWGAHVSRPVPSSPAPARPPPPPSSDIHVCTPAGSCSRPRLMRGRNGRRGVVDSIGSLCAADYPARCSAVTPRGQPPDSRRTAAGRTADSRRTDAGQPPDGRRTAAGRTPDSRRTERRDGLRTAADTYCSKESGTTAGHWRRCRKERVCSKANWTVSGGEAILVCCIERRDSRKSLA